MFLSTNQESSPGGDQTVLDGYNILEQRFELLLWLFSARTGALPFWAAWAAALVSLRAWPPWLATLTAVAALLTTAVSVKAAPEPRTPPR